MKVLNLHADSLKLVFKKQAIEILSDEIEVLEESQFSHRLLFSTKQDVDIQFEDIELKIQNATSQQYKKALCLFKLE